MDFRIARIKYCVGYLGTKLVLSRRLGTFRVPISGYFDMVSSTLERRYPRCVFRAKYVQDRCDSKYFRCADAGQLQGVFGAKCVQERAVVPPRVPMAW